MSNIMKILSAVLELYHVYRRTDGLRDISRHFAGLRTRLKKAQITVNTNLPFRFISFQIQIMLRA